MGAGERHKMMDTIDMLFTTLTIRAVVITVIMIVRENGGYIVHAHPFREKANAYRIDMIRLMPRDVDAVETYNAHSSDFQNSMAEKYADAYKLPKLCGSDNHTGVQGVFAGVEFNEKLISSENFIKKLISEWEQLFD